MPKNWWYRIELWVQGDAFYDAQLTAVSRAIEWQEGIIKVAHERHAEREDVGRPYRSYGNSLSGQYFAQADELEREAKQMRTQATHALFSELDQKRLGELQRTQQSLSRLRYGGAQVKRVFDRLKADGYTFSTAALATGLGVAAAGGTSEAEAAAPEPAFRGRLAAIAAVMALQEENATSEAAEAPASKPAFPGRLAHLVWASSQPHQPEQSMPYAAPASVRTDIEKSARKVGIQPRAIVNELVPVDE